MYKAILNFALAFKINYGYHNQVRFHWFNIFQTEQFSAVTFAMGYEKNIGFLVIPESPKIWKTDETIGLGSFKN